MARCLIIGCGCRGGVLGRELRARGHAVRGTTRDPERAAALEADGIEAVVGDPDRVGTIAAALEHVVVVCVLLASATGSPESLAALHGPRLEMLLSRTLDSTAHGLVYECCGSVDRAALERGAGIVRRVCEGSRIPYALLDADPKGYEAWLEAAVQAIEQLMSLR